MKNEVERGTYITLSIKWKNKYIRNKGELLEGESEGLMLRLLGLVR